MKDTHIVSPQVQGSNCSHSSLARERLSAHRSWAQMHSSGSTAERSHVSRALHAAAAAASVDVALLLVHGCVAACSAACQHLPYLDRLLVLTLVRRGIDTQRRQGLGGVWGVSGSSRRERRSHSPPLTPTTSSADGQCYHRATAC